MFDTVVIIVFLFFLVITIYAQQNPAVTECIHDLKYGNPDTKRYAAMALGELGDKSAVPALIEALKDETVDPRVSVYQPLRKPGDTSVVPTLFRKFKDAGLRCCAAEALGRIGDTSTLETLTYVAENDEDTRVRTIAKEAINKIKP